MFHIVVTRADGRRKILEDCHERADIAEWHAAWWRKRLRGVVLTVEEANVRKEVLPRPTGSRPRNAADCDAVQQRQVGETASLFLR